MRKVILYGFVCGALAVLLFHQGTTYVLHHQFPLVRTITGAADAFRPVSPGYSMRAVPPLGLPHVVWITLLGGLGGMLLAALIRFGRMPDLLVGFLLGGIGLTLLDFSLGAQLRGEAMWAGGNSIAWWRAVIVNGAWGWGTAFLLRPFSLNGN